MTGPQLLDDIKKSGIDLGAREAVLEKLLGPFKEKEVPPNLAKMILEEVGAAPRPSANSPDTRPDSLPAIRGQGEDPVSRDEFDDLEDRVSFLEEEMGLDYADDAEGGIDTGPSGPPLPPLPPRPPEKASRPMGPPLPPLPPRPPERASRSLSPPVGVPLPPVPAVSPRPERKPLPTEPRPLPADIKLPVPGAPPPPPGEPVPAPLSTSDTAEKKPSPEEIALTAAAEKKAQEDKQQVDQVLSELQTIKKSPPPPAATPV